MRQRPKRDVAQEITNLIIKTIEAGTLPWRRPWKKTGMGGAPLRAAGVPYTGINRLYLWAVADHYGYGSRYWMTWRQAIELGGKVRKGETALVDRFNKAIEAIRANGKYKEINDKYFKFDVYGAE